jgi:hypothetical protein
MQVYKGKVQRRMGEAEFSMLWTIMDVNRKRKWQKGSDHENEKGKSPILCNNRFTNTHLSNTNILLQRTGKYVKSTKPSTILP